MKTNQNRYAFTTQKISNLPFLSVLLCLIILASCSKTDIQQGPTPAPGPVPVISFVSATPTTVHQFTDSIIFVINYADGDGDLGNANADSSSLFLIDTRKNLIEPYHIPPLTPGTAKISISGTLSIKLGSYRFAKWYHKRNHNVPNIYGG